MIRFHIPFQPNMLFVCWPSPITILHSLLLSTSLLITHLTQTYCLHHIHLHVLLLLVRSFCLHHVHVLLLLARSFYLHHIHMSMSYYQ
ncbi:hypothetical protein B0O80DRAFT_474444, partial [Mortierella sp. GBAus27b]